MSILIKSQILEQVKSGKIAFDPPLDQFQVQCHAVDLRLGFTFLIPKQWHLTPKGREALNLDYFHLDRSKYFDVLELEKGQYFEILPNEYVMVSTLESVKLPLDLMAVLYPRSSINRRGLSVELSGIITAGYEGQLIIPVKNNTQAQIIKLYPGERFCQIVFEELSREAEVAKSKYHKKDIISGVLPEEQTEENDLIVKGEISKLKERYSIK
jgi:dCTP deaminase